MAAQHRTPAYCPHGDRLSRLHRGCDWEAAAIVATRLATRARSFARAERVKLTEASKLFSFRVATSVAHGARCTLQSITLGRLA